MSALRTVALIDGEHYFPVVIQALEKLRADGEHKLVGAVFIGGTEKLTDSTDFSGFGVPVILDKDPMRGIDLAIAKYAPDVFVDLSDEPVVGYKERFACACRILSHSIIYKGSDFLFEPPIFEDIVHKPSISIIGTGKRTGKTAVSAYACRILKSEGRAPCVVAMGRGGPKKPEVIYGGDIELKPDYLLKLSRSGKHAASDHYEDALVSRVTTVGCRRCGGGMAGQVFISNVAEGARIADGLPEQTVIFEGSGAAIPPVRTDARIVIIGAGQPEEYISGYFGPYRIGLSDLAVITMCEESTATAAKTERLADAVRAAKPGIKVVKTVFRPKALADISGRRVMVATTAPDSAGPGIKRHLEEQYGCAIDSVSHRLSNRPLLRQDLAASGDCEVILTELKAAAVDVVTEFGLENGKEIVFMDNDPVTVGGDGELRDLLIEVETLAVDRHNHSRR